MNRNSIESVSEGRKKVENQTYIANQISTLPLTSVMVRLQFVDHSNRRKRKSCYSMRRENSISAIIFIWLYFVAISIFVIRLGRFAPFAK